MVGRVLIAGVISALLMMVWGFLFWGVFNIGGKLVKPLPEGFEPDKALREALPESGMYVYPSPVPMGDTEAHAKFEAQHLAGPRFRLSYQAEGGPVMPPATMLKGLVLNLAVALLAGCLTTIAGRSLPRFSSRLGFVLLLSLLASVWGNVADAIWWFHSPEYCLGNIAYGLGAGLIMAAVIALIVRPSTEQAVD